jgi:hypothetical protein
MAYVPDSKNKQRKTGGLGGSKGSATGISSTGNAPNKIKGINPDSNINQSAQTNALAIAGQKVGEALNYPGEALGRTAKQVGEGLRLAGGAVGDVDSAIKSGYVSLGDRVVPPILSASTTSGGRQDPLGDITNAVKGGVESVSDTIKKLDPNRAERISSANAKYLDPLKEYGTALYNAATTPIVPSPIAARGLRPDSLTSAIKEPQSTQTPTITQKGLSSPDTTKLPLAQTETPINNLVVDKKGISSNQYSAPGVEVSSPTLKITGDQKEYLDRTLEYNRRPEVIAGFARNAALSQARYDEYNKSKEKDAIDSEIGSIKERLNYEQNKAFPNPNAVNSLYDRLKTIESGRLASETLTSDREKSSAANVLDQDKGRAGILQAATETERKNNDSFIKNIQGFAKNGISLTPENILSTASTQGIRITPDLLSFSGIDTGTLNKIYNTKDPKAFAELLGSLNVPSQYIEQLYNSLQ